VDWSAQSLPLYLTFFATLTVITDPLGNLLLFLLFTEGHTPREWRRVAAVSTAAAALILAFFALTGGAVLEFFSVELPAFQIAGGLIFFIYGLQMLRLIPSGIRTTEPEEEESITKENVALVPLAIPLIAGPGAITTVMVWRERLAGPDHLVPLMVAIVAACLVSFLVFFFGRWLRRLLGISGIRVAERLMGLFLAVIAVQFVVRGIQSL